MLDRNCSSGPSKDLTEAADTTMSDVTPSPPLPAIPTIPVGALPTPTDPKLEKVPAGLKPPVHPRPATSTCLKKNISVVGGLFFQNMAEAKAFMDFAQWRAPAQDNTIPQTDKEHQDIAKKLVHAFKDMSVAKDTPDNAYRKRLTPGELVYYQDWAIEACAWDIIRKVKTIHTEGFKVPIYDKSIIDSIGQTQYWTFQERIEWICVVLRTSKNVAVTLMKNEKTWTILGAPHKMYHSTLTNAVANAHRGVWVKNGRQADTQHQARTSSKRQRLSQVLNYQNDGAKDALDTGYKESNADTTTASVTPAECNKHTSTATATATADDSTTDNATFAQQTSQSDSMTGITYLDILYQTNPDPEREPEPSAPSNEAPSVHSPGPHAQASSSTTMDDSKGEYNATDLEGAKLLVSLHTAS